MKIGLVLEGGAMRGMYTAGVLDVFLENQIRIDGIIGVSAGAVFGVNYPSKQRKRVLNYNKRFVNDKRYMGIRSLLKTGNIVNKDFAYYEVPQKLDVFDEKEFESSDTVFYAVITNLETGGAEYVKIDNVFEQMEVLRASSSMPFVSKIIEIDGKKYLDGGIADSIPVDKCKQMGYDKIIIVLTRPADYRKKGSKRKDILSKLIYGKYPKFREVMKNRPDDYNRCVEGIAEMEKNGEIFVIRPSRTVKISRMEKDPDVLQEMYDLGVDDCNKCLPALEKYLNNGQI